MKKLNKLFLIFATIVLLYLLIASSFRQVVEVEKVDNFTWYNQKRTNENTEYVTMKLLLNQRHYMIMK